jgi:Cu2+-exporting ATPase
MKIKKTVDDHAMSHSGHDHIAMIADFKKRFYVILLLTVPIVFLSPMIRHFAGVNW